MTITVSDSELIKKFLEGKQDIYKTIIVDACGTIDFPYRAKLIYNAINDNTDEDDYPAILASNGCQALSSKSDCVAFYKAHRTLFIDWLKSISNNSGSEQDILNTLSLIFYGEPRNKAKAVFMDDEEIDCYTDWVVGLINHIRIKLSVDFTRFANKYRKEHEFFDIDFSHDANLTLNAKRLLLKGLPEFYITDDGVIHNSNGQPILAPSNSLGDMIDIIHNAGYQKGCVTDNDWDIN